MACKMKQINRNELFTVAELKSRGWTDSLISDMLVYPDVERRNPYGHSLGTAGTHMYLVDRVIITESSSEWLAHYETCPSPTPPAKNTVSTKQSKFLAFVDALDIQIPCVPLSRVTDMACRVYNQRISVSTQPRDYYRRQATEESHPAFLERITVNYLRHEMTCYDSQLERMFSKGDLHEAYPVLRRKILTKIAETYPELAHECRRQTERTEIGIPG